MIKLRVTMHIRGREFSKGYYLPNLDEHKEFKLYQYFGQMFRCVMFQILKDINGLSKDDADKQSRRGMFHAFKSIAC